MRSHGNSFSVRCGCEPISADERALRVSRWSNGVDHRGASFEATAAGVLFGVRLPRTVHVHALRVSVLQLQVLRAAQGDPLPQVRVVGDPSGWLSHS